jgi:hypothetical protein
MGQHMTKVSPWYRAVDTSGGSASVRSYTIVGHSGSLELHLVWHMVDGLGSREAQNKEETEGILTKGFTTKGCPR